MRQRIKRLIRSEWFFAAFFAALYLLVNAVLLSWHEPWRDEAQAWLLSRDLRFSGLLNWASVDGHPALWWFVLAPFSKLGLPYRLIGLVSLILMSAAVLLFLRYAPLPRLVRAAFVFSPCCVYWYPVIARCYALIPLALVLLVFAYQKRNQRPIRYALALLLLSETHVIMEGLVGILMLFFWIEEIGLIKKRAVKPAPALCGMGLNVFAVVALYLQLSGSIGENIAYGVDLSGSFPTHLLGLCKNLFSIFKNVFGITFLPAAAALAVPAAVLFFIGVTFWAKLSLKPALIFLFGVGFQVCVYEFIYGNVLMQRYLTAVYIFLFCAVLTLLEQPESLKPEAAKPAPGGGAGLCRRRFRVFTAAVVALLFLLPFNSFWQDMADSHTSLYSASGEAADYIKSELPQNALVIGDCEYRTSAVAAYFPRDAVFYNPRRHSGEMFSTWSEESALPLDLDAAIAELSGLTGAADRPWYLLASLDYGYGQNHVEGGLDAYVEDGTLTYLASFYADLDQIADESYALYRINPPSAS